MVHDLAPRLLGAALSILLLLCAPPAHTRSRERLNVLLIISDDLRSAPLDPAVQRPNYDRLAERAMTFHRAYTQQPSCNPSRTSMLTGLRPETTGISDNEVFYRTVLPEIVTLPQAFLAAGYFTASVGKVFHKQHLWRESDTWLYESFPRGKPIGRKGRSRQVTGGAIPNDQWRAARGRDRDQPDGAATREVVRLLRKRGDEPFFIAVGFLRPHAPFRAPRADFKAYPLEGLPDSFDPLPESTVPAPAIPNASFAAVMEAMTDDDRRELMRAYYACTTFVDRQIGVILRTLDSLGLWENTIVVVTSDHGFHLGEHGWWGKNTLFEESLRVPLLIHAPTMAAAGETSDQPVELLDLYPTLTELAGIPAPPGLEGQSLVPLLATPGLSERPAFSQTHRNGGLGRSVVEGRWRYNRWSATGEVELYDTTDDPRQTENLAGRPELAEVEAHLSQLLRID